MNLRFPDAPQSGARSEGAALRFLRWLIERPVEPQPATSRILRWLLRAVAFSLYCMLVGEAGDAGNAGVGPKGGKSGKPPA